MVDMRERGPIKYSRSATNRFRTDKFPSEIPYAMYKNVLSETEMRDWIFQIMQNNKDKPDNKKVHVVMVSGVFDTFHVGHVLFLTLASDIAKEWLEKENSGRARVLARVAGDQYARQFKGEGRPINSEINRALVVANTKNIDKVFIDREVIDPQDIEANSSRLKEIGADIIVIEIDDSNLDNKIEAANNAGIDCLIINPSEIESTTSTINRIRNLP
jgi:bifunctional ADP-heptose synthase (sugar kinase/adenylyltransferase)